MNAATPEQLICTMRWGKLLAIILLMPFPCFMICGIMYISAGSGFATSIGTAFAGFWLFCWYNVLFRRQVLVIDHVGIEDHRTGLGIIAWEDIDRVIEVRGREGANNILIRVFDEAKYLSILPWYRRLSAPIQRLRGQGPFLIDCFALKPDVGTIIEHIRMYLPARATDTNESE